MDKRPDAYASNLSGSAETIGDIADEKEQAAQRASVAREAARREAQHALSYNQKRVHQQES